MEIIDNIIKRIYLVYNLVGNSQAKLKLDKKKKIELVLLDKNVPLNIIENIDHSYYNKYVNSRSSTVRNYLLLVYYLYWDSF